MFGQSLILAELFSIFHTLGEPLATAFSEGFGASLSLKIFSLLLRFHQQTLSPHLGGLQHCPRLPLDVGHRECASLLLNCDVVGFDYAHGEIASCELRVAC